MTLVTHDLAWLTFPQSTLTETLVFHCDNCLYAQTDLHYLHKLVPIAKYSRFIRQRCLKILLKIEGTEGYILAIFSLSSCSPEQLYPNTLMIYRISRYAWKYQVCPFSIATLYRIYSFLSVHDAMSSVCKSCNSLYKINIHSWQFKPLLIFLTLDTKQHILSWKRTTWFAYASALKCKSCICHCVCVTKSHVGSANASARKFFISYVGICVCACEPGLRFHWFVWLIWHYYHDS